MKDDIQSNESLEMKMKKQIGNSVKLGFGNKSTTTPYNDALDAVRDFHAEKVKESAPYTLSKLIVEEAFSILHSTALYSGMGEEAITVYFSAALATAEVIWRRNWIWEAESEGGQIIWSHYSDKTETLLGADFSLVLVDFDQETGGLQYRMIIAQAKKLKALNPRRVDVKRKAFSTSKDNPEPKDWEVRANEDLRSALKGEVIADASVEAPNWQFTRLKALEKRLEKEKFSLPSIIYVIWPETPTKDGDQLNPVFYEELSVVSNAISDLWKEKKCYTQSFDLDKNKIFRDYLLNSHEIASMTKDELMSALEIVQADCAATILINSSGKQLDAELKGKFNKIDLKQYESYKLNNSPVPNGH